MKLCTFTKTDGSQVVINPEFVIAVEEASVGGTKIYLNRLVVIVKESLTEIFNRLQSK